MFNSGVCDLLTAKGRFHCTRNYEKVSGLSLGDRGW